MQIKQILKISTEKLKNCVENSNFEAEILLGYFLCKSREWLTAHDEDEVGDCEEFFGLVERRIGGEPLAYILGYQEFFGRKFSVNPSVLIPRPETEIIIEEALKFIHGKEKIIDVGTGSGAIGITIALEKPQTKVTLLEISSEALVVARANAENLKASVRFMQSADFFDQDLEQFEIILANLPYIPTAEPQIQKSVLDFEPHLALFGGEDGLDHYRNLFARLSQAKFKPHVMICEIAYNQGKIFREIVQKFFPEAKLTIRTDHAGFDRTAIIVFNASV